MMSPVQHGPADIWDITLKGSRGMLLTFIFVNGTKILEQEVTNS